MANGIWDGGSSNPAGGAPVWDGDQYKGEKGDAGAPAATIAVGTVTSGATPSVTNAGTPQAAVFNFVLAKGDTGATGATGAAGVGIVAGGTAGQIYTKQSSTNYDASWQNAPVGLPTATTGQIPVYNGSNWEADTQWVKNGSNVNYSLGNVGIGTASPTQKAHITGNLRVTGAYYDSTNSTGTTGFALFSTLTGTAWSDPIDTVKSYQKNYYVGKFSLPSAPTTKTIITSITGVASNGITQSGGTFTVPKSGMYAINLESSGDCVNSRTDWYQEFHLKYEINGINFGGIDVRVPPSGTWNIRGNATPYIYLATSDVLKLYVQIIANGTLSSASGKVAIKLVG